MSASNKAMWEDKASRDQCYDYKYSDEELKTWGACNFWPGGGQ